MLALLPSSELDLAAGLLIGGLFALSFISSVETRLENRSMPTIPENVATSSAELQTAYDEALSKAGEAQQRETEAVQARDTAEAAKESGRQANARLQAKAAAHLSLLSSFYQAPVLPPPAVPVQPTTPVS